MPSQGVSRVLTSGDCIGSIMELEQSIVFASRIMDCTRATTTNGIAVVDVILLYSELYFLSICRLERVLLALNKRA